MTERPAVLVTRPVGQAEGLSVQLEAAGLSAIALPAIEIAAPADLAAADALIDRLEDYRLAVFISVNAVERGLSRILARRDWPGSVQIATVGSSSAAAVVALGLQVDLVPEHEFSSEGLLAMPALQDLTGWRIVILRGNGGRDTLMREFTVRGAQAEYVEVYQRRCPQESAPRLLSLLQQGSLRAVTATSNETLQNLYDMAGAAGRSALLDLPLVVASRRQAALAAQLGFRQGAIIAGHASDAAMLDGVLQLGLQ